MPTEPQQPDEIYDARGVPARSTAEWMKELAWSVPNLAKMLGRLAKDPRVPARSKTFAGGVAAYLVSPVDLIPDFIPLIGKTDDLLVAAFAINHLIRSAGEDVVREHWDGPDDILDLISDITAVGARMVPRTVRMAFGRILKA